MASKSKSSKTSKKGKRKTRKVGDRYAFPDRVVAVRVSKRMTGKSNDARDAKYMALPPGKRLVLHPDGRITVYYEYRQNRSDPPETAKRKKRIVVARKTKKKKK